MKQLPPGQPAEPRPSAPKIIPLLQRNQGHPHKNMKIFRSKKLIKRYEQLPDSAHERWPGEKEGSREELKNFIAGQLNHSSMAMAPLTMKLVERQSRGGRSGAKLRCSTEAAEKEETDESLLFTFYPKPKLSQDHNAPSMPQNHATLAKRLELRSYSLKNSPIVSYPLSNKILPRAFRVRTDSEGNNIKRSSELPREGAALQENRMHIRNYSSKCRVATQGLPSQKLKVVL